MWLVFDVAGVAPTNSRSNCYCCLPTAMTSKRAMDQENMGGLDGITAFPKSLPVMARSSFLMLCSSFRVAVVSLQIFGLRV